MMHVTHTDGIIGVCEWPEEISQTDIQVTGVVEQKRRQVT
jgi:hypothetical protein